MAENQCVGRGAADRVVLEVEVDWRRLRLAMHIELFVVGAPAGKTQPVEVAALGDDLYRVLYSPGLVEGIAANDVIRLVDHTLGTFEVVERGHNVAVKVASSSEISNTLAEIERVLAPLGARRDGAISKAAVWTIPVTPGFEAIEAAMTEIMRIIPESEWWYGNVYDESGNPLNWWKDTGAA